MKTKLSPSNFTKNKSPSQLASKNFTKILIYLSVYISLYLGIVAFKISDKLQEINQSFKSDSHLPKKILFICFNDSPLKMMKNVFYFILKALFALKIFKFLS